MIEWPGLMTSRVDAELLANADIQPVRHHDQARGDLFAGRQLDGLPLGTGRDVGDFGVDELTCGRNLRRAWC